MNCASAASIQATSLTLKKSTSLIRQMRYSGIPQLLGLSQHHLSRWTQCASSIPPFPPISVCFGLVKGREQGAIAV